jgi:prepilin-type N-terminal cleavage/methylation domain-containing protein
MRLATGHPPPPRVEHGPRRAFTLVELVVVLSLMVIVISVAAPTFKAFLKGRDLENEARRMLSLTHYGAIRAVSEGLPVDLWINVKQGRYGLAACGGYTESKTNAVSFYLNNESDAQKQSLQLQVSQPPGMLTTASVHRAPRGHARHPLSARRLHQRYQPENRQVRAGNGPRNLARGKHEPYKI